MLDSQWRRGDLESLINSVSTQPNARVLNKFSKSIFSQIKSRTRKIHSTVSTYFYTRNNSSHVCTMVIAKPVQKSFLRPCIIPNILIAPQTDTRFLKEKTRNLFSQTTYLQKTFQTSDRVHQDRPEKLDQKGCSVCCQVPFAVVVGFVRQRSLSILALRTPMCCQRFL